MISADEFVYGKGSGKEMEEYRTYLAGNFTEDAVSDLIFAFVEKAKADAGYDRDETFLLLSVPESIPRPVRERQSVSVRPRSMKKEKKVFSPDMFVDILMHLGE